MDWTEQKKKNKKCKKCKNIFLYNDCDVFWNEGGFGYSTKLVKCNRCGCINIIAHLQDRSMKLNNDSRFYDYGREKNNGEN